jgi:hypothetical protein
MCKNNHGVSGKFQQIREEVCLTMTKKLTNSSIYDNETMHTIQVKDALNGGELFISVIACLYCVSGIV